MYVLQFPSNDLIHINTITYYQYPDAESGFAQEDKDGNKIGEPQYLNLQSSHSADDFKVVWHRGKTFLSSYCFEDETIENMPNFWLTIPHEEGDPQIPLSPFMAVADHITDKYFGVGYDKYNVGGIPNQPYVCYGEEEQAEEGQEVMVDMLHVISSDFSKKITGWSCLDVSVDSTIVFIGGHKDNVGTLGAVTFDINMKSVKFMPVDSKGRAKNVDSLRRFKGTNTLLAGTAGFIFVHSYADKNFTPLKTFEIPQCGPIQEIRITPSKIFVMDKDGKIFLRKAGCKTDHEKNWQIGRSLTYLEYSKFPELKELMK